MKLYSHFIPGGISNFVLKTGNADGNTFGAYAFLTPRRLFQFLVVLCVFAAGSSSAVAEEESSTEKPAGITPEDVDLGRPVDFEEDIVPILDNNCVACHNVADAESRFNIETVETILKGGKKGAAVVPGKPEESLLFHVAARTKEPHMPPLPNEQGAEAFTPRELGLLKQWIIEGAKAGKQSKKEMIRFQPLPSSLQPIYSLALSPWAQVVAAGRANQVVIYDLQSGTLLQKLVDPALKDLKFNDELMYPQGATHQDLVQSLAFSPDGYTLATGGYRVVKLWKRVDPQQTWPAVLNEKTSAAVLGADASWIAIAHPQQLQIVQAGTDQVLQTIPIPAGKVASLSVWPSTSHLSQQSALQQQAIDKLAQAQAAVNAADQALKSAENDENKKALAQKQTELTAAQQAKENAEKAYQAFLQKVKAESRVATSSSDGFVRVWRVADGKLLGQWKTPNGANTALLSEDGQSVYSGGTDGVIHQWVISATFDTDPLFALKPNQARPAVQSAKQLAGHSKPITSLANVPQKPNMIVSSSEDGSTRIWDVAAAKQLHQLDHGSAVTSVAVKQDGQQVASAGVNGVVKLWNTADGKMAYELKGNLTTQRDVVLHTEAQTIANDQFTQAEAAHKAGEAQQKDRTESKKKAEEQKTAADKKVPEEMEKQKKADEALVAAQEKLKADPENAELKKAAEAAQKAATDAKTAVENAKKAQEKAVAALARAEKTLAAATARTVELKTELDAAQQVKEKAAATLEEVKKADAQTSPIVNLSFSPNGNLLATVDDQGTVQQWTLSNQKLFASGKHHQLSKSVLQYFSNEELIVSNDALHVTLVGNKPRWEFAGRIGGSEENPVDVSESPFTSRVLALSFHPNGKRLAIGGGEPSRSGQLLIWDLESDSLVREFTDAHSDTVLGVEFSHDGRYLLSGAADKFAKVFDCETGDALRSYEGHTHHVLDVSWKGDGGTIATAGADNAIKVWNTETGEQRRTISGYSKQVTSIHFVGAGAHIVSSGGDKTVRLHNTADGKGVRNFAGSTDYLYASAVSRDESVVAAGGEAGVIHIWNGKDGKALHTLAPVQ